MGLFLANKVRGERETKKIHKILLLSTNAKVAPRKLDLSNDSLYSRLNE